MQGHQTMSGLWLPGERKRDGGTYFDDELTTAQRALVDETVDLVNHINQRPDHVLYVSSTGDREKMRAVIDWMLKDKLIGRKPKIKIEYGLRDGEVRMAP